MLPAIQDLHDLVRAAEEAAFAEYAASGIPDMKISDAQKCDLRTALIARHRIPELHTAIARLVESFN